MIRLTRHATAAMELRNIPFEGVDRTLRFPDWTEVDPRQTNLTRAFKAIPAFDAFVLLFIPREQISL